jgi:serine/threonine protein kinase
MNAASKEDKKEKIVQKYYRIVKKLGEGAFGEIYLATNTLDNSEVALKI